MVFSSLSSGPGSKRWASHCLVGHLGHTTLGQHQQPRSPTTLASAMASCGLGRALVGQLPWPHPCLTPSSRGTLKPAQPFSPAQTWRSRAAAFPDIHMPSILPCSYLLVFPTASAAPAVLWFRPFSLRSPSVGARTTVFQGLGHCIQKRCHSA